MEMDLSIAATGGRRGEEEKGVELREFHIRSLQSPHGGKGLGVTLCLDISIKGRHTRKSAKLG